MRGVARLDHLAEKQMETSPTNVAGDGPIDTLDNKESALEEDPEPADDLHNVILDKKGEDQPCPAGTAADSVMDPQAKVGTSTPNLDAAALPTEEDPKQVDDLHDVILDKRGEDQPCPVGTVANLTMDPQVEAVASTPSLDAGALPTDEALGKPTLPSSALTETPETQDLGAEDVVVLLHKEEMTDFP